VKTTRLLLAAAAMIFASLVAWSCYTGSRAAAQQPPTGMAVGPSAQLPPGPIALVDVNYIFRQHVRLKAQLKDLQADAEAVQKGFERDLQQLQDQKRQLSEMKPGSNDYQRTEEALVSQEANLKGKIALKRKEFVQKEAHLYYNAYREISDEVGFYCQRNGIALVLNFNGDKIHEENPDDIARGIGNKVVFYAKNLDITPNVMRRFVEPLPQSTPGPQPAFNQPMQR
jgi:Skp family chaperone for outer membrane proteins